MNDVQTQKEALRAEAKRARGLMSLSGDEQERLCTLFFENVPLSEKTVIAAYWPKGRELDTQVLMDAIIKRGYWVALPVIEKDSLVLKFARWHEGIDMSSGAFGVSHPVINDQTEWLEPDVFLVPMLAFDRRGSRLGYGGGYYDATLAAYRERKDVLAVGLAYAKQACLFNLPNEAHDVRMDWIVTEQGVFSF